MNKQLYWNKTKAKAVLKQNAQYTTTLTYVNHKLKGVHLKRVLLVPPQSQGWKPSSLRSTLNESISTSLAAPG